MLPAAQGEPCGVGVDKAMVGVVGSIARMFYFVQFSPAVRRHPPPKQVPLAPSPTRWAEPEATLRFYHQTMKTHERTDRMFSTSSLAFHKKHCIISPHVDHEPSTCRGHILVPMVATVVSSDKARGQEYRSRQKLGAARHRSGTLHRQRRLLRSKTRFCCSPRPTRTRRARCRLWRNGQRAF